MEWIEILPLVREEYFRAIEKFGPFNTAHEGYAVILEEVDELWEAIKGNKSISAQKEEAIQVAAMAIRFIIDCCEPKE